MLREQIRTIARVTDRPFCVNLVLDFAQDERLEVVVEERVRWVSFSFGLRPELVRLARAGGSRVLVQVASADGARAAADAGADALIVQGVEAGGHVESVVGLFPLLAEVRRAVSIAAAGRGRNRRPGVRARRARRRCLGCRDGDAIRGQRRVRRPSALQGAAACGRRS
jgi:NAD(P)H-dependent flavin oxidoreductase YrpB (nitropropane dioxygenase family)